MNAIAFGGVDIGIIKAQLAAKTIGSVKRIMFIFISAKHAKIGRNKKVVAVLLVNSVINEVKSETTKIITKIS